MSKIIITGGMGFIGSELVRSLFNKHQIYVYDKPRIEMIDYFADIPIRLIDRDKGIESIYDINPDIIIHMGAKSSTDLVSASIAYEENTLLTNNLIDYSMNQKKKLIYASSAATYGDGAKGFKDSDNFYELRKLKPLNLYGWSKHNSDLYFTHHLLNGRANNNIVGLKFFNVYGKNEVHKRNMASVISQMIPQIKNKKTVRLYKHIYNNKKIEGRRDFISCEDIIKIINMLIKIDFKSSIYNVGTGKARSFSELIRYAFNALNAKEKIKFVPLPRKYHGKYQMYTEAQIYRLKQLLPGFEFTDHSQAIKRILC